MNEDKIYNILLNESEYDKYGLKLYNYLKIVTKLSYEHLKQTDQGINVIIKDKYAWAVIAMKLHILKPLKQLVNLTGKTWYAGKRGPFYRREYEIFLNGKQMMVGGSYSVLLNVIDRSVYRKRELPFEELIMTDKQLCEIETSFKEEISYTFLKEGKILEEHIDALGHTNHLNYMKFIYESLDDDLIKEVNTYNTLDLFFQKEMIKDDVFTVNKGYLNNNLVFQIYNKTNGEVAFTLKLSNEEIKVC